MKIDLSKKRGGYSLVEIVIYVAILSVLSVTMINTIISFTKTHHSVVASRLVEQAGVSSIERISRDIRSATSINGESVLGTNPGVLKLVSTYGGVSTTTKFYLLNNRLSLDINDVYFGPLTQQNVSITNMVFTSITNSNTKAIKVDITIQATSGTFTKTQIYHTTVVLKG